MCLGVYPGNISLNPQKYKRALTNFPAFDDDRLPDRSKSLIKFLVLSRIGVVDSVLGAPVIEYRGQKSRELFRGRGKGRKTEGGEFVCDLLIPGGLIRGGGSTIVEREQ